MPRHFTLAEAESLLPDVERAIREALETKGIHEEATALLEATVQRVEQTGGASVDRDAFSQLKKRRHDAETRLTALLEQIQAFGCEVKDLDIGLIDFRSYYRGEEVYLCWKLGEEGISWWHGLQDGFRGRRKIDSEFLDNHKGDRSH